MNVYIFLVFFSVYFCLISSTFGRRHKHHYLGKKIGHQLSKKALRDELPDKRNLKTSKAGAQSGAVYNGNHLHFKRNDVTEKRSPKKDTRKSNILANKKEVKAIHLLEKKDRPHGNIKSHKTRGTSNFKPKAKSKKFSLPYAPSSSLTPQAETGNGYQEYAPQTSGQVGYLTNNPGNPGSDNQDSQNNVVQFTGQQQGFQTLNGGQNEVNSFQVNNNGQEAQEGDEGKQSVGTLQELMEQKALQENQQEEMQGLPNQQQETVAFQGSQEPNREGHFFRQEEDEQQSAPQDGVEQFQQGVGRQTTEQQMNVQEQGGQDGNNQEVNLQEGGEQGNLIQQGANQEAPFQQGNEQGNGEQQAGQMQGSFQQENGPEIVPQQGQYVHLALNMGYLRCPSSISQ